MARYSPTGESESGSGQRVVVIQDASRESGSSAIKWAIGGLSLKPGDELTLLGVLHQVNNPSTFPFMGAGKFMGYKIRLDATNQKIIDEEVTKKELEYQNNPEIMHISKLYEMNKITFRMRVVAASSAKVGAFEAVKKLSPTWIILDRQMKKDKKFFMDTINCGISRMKRNNSVELLRGPKTENGEHAKGSRSRYVTYDEMLEEDVKPGTSKGIQETHDDENLFSLLFDAEDLFSLETHPLNRMSIYQNNSNVKMGIDSGEGMPDVYSVATSSFTSKSSENLFSESTASSSVHINPEYLSKQIYDDENSHSQKSAIDDDSSFVISNTSKSECMEPNEALDEEESGQEGMGFPEEITTYEFTYKKLEEHGACSYCGKGIPRMESKLDFRYSQLYAATNGFSKDNFLSEGGFGSVYKGRLKDGQWIAVKQHKHASLQGEKEFRSEVDVLSRARHRNVVRLLGSCSKGSRRLLVYEYICNGSLDIHLSKSRPTALSWENRMNIALGVAQGLKYLHQNNIIHRDMRPNNILINHDYQPLLGDFGLAKTQQNEPDHSSEHKVVGTLGYMAPEYAESGRVTSKSDIYSFGVVLLELITGQTTMDETVRKNSLVDWARPLLKKKKYPELIDERILDCHDVHQLFWMVRVAENCLQKDPYKRPSMEEVETTLKCIMEGGTVLGIEDLSPTCSSDSNFENSNESNGEEEEEDIINSQASLIIKSEIVEEAFPLSLKLSYSSSKSLGALFKESSSGKKRSPKARAKPRSPQVLYDEMLD